MKARYQLQKKKSKNIFYSFCCLTSNNKIAKGPMMKEVCLLLLFVLYQPSMNIFRTVYS